MGGRTVGRSLSFFLLFSGEKVVESDGENDGIETDTVADFLGVVGCSECAFGFECDGENSADLSPRGLATGCRSDEGVPGALDGANGDFIAGAWLNRGSRSDIISGTGSSAS